MKELTSFVYLIGYDENFKAHRNTGWGCGYVAIPSNHPAAKQHFERISKDWASIPDDDYMSFVNTYFEGYSEQEINYTNTRVIDGNDYLVVGFDTDYNLTVGNNDFDYCYTETLKLKNFIDSIKYAKSIS